MTEIKKVLAPTDLSAFSVKGFVRTDGQRVFGFAPRPRTQHLLPHQGAPNLKYVLSPRETDPSVDEGRTFSPGNRSGGVPTSMRPSSSASLT